MFMLAEENIKRQVYETLRDLGANVELKGYHYASYILQECLSGRMDVHSSITKEIYPNVAKAFDTTSSRVERAIRHMVECIFDNVEPKIIYKYFGNAIPINKGKVANSQFIASIVEYIKIYYKEQ